MRLFTRHQTDTELIAGIRAGGALRRLSENHLFEKYNYLILAAVRKHRLTEDDCASAYSDAILSVINNIVTSQFEGRSELKTYIHQVFTNKCVDLIRKKTTNRQSVHDAISLDDSLLQLPDDTRLIIQQLIHQQDAALLRQRLQELGDKCREMLQAWGNGYSDEEIAQTMRYNSAAVSKTSRLRCMERLRELYQNSRK